MLFSKYLITTWLFIFLFSPITMNISIFADQVEKVEMIVKLKKKLSMLLDSLELEKQTRIRKEQSFEDLEDKSRKIRDSINTLRENINRSEIRIQKPVEPIKNKPSLVSFLKSLLKPKDAFEWVIFIIGLITFLSVMILFIGIFYAFFSGRAKRQKTASIKKDKKPPLTQSSLSLSHSPASVSDSSVDIDNKNINNLRKIINNDIKSLEQFNVNSSPFRAPGLQGENTEHFDKGRSISEKIVRAANEGLTVLEISRKYHISVNKVSLILHMQDINKQKKR